MPDAAPPLRPVAGQDPESGRTRALPARPLDDRLLRAALQDLVGRPPYEEERRTWLGRGLVELLAERIGGEEFWAHWIDEQLYYFLLIDNFRPRSERVLALPAELARGSLEARDAIWSIALSPSFDRRNPGPDTFVSVVLEQLDGLTVQRNTRELEIGKAAYDGKSGLFLGKLTSSQAELVRVAIQDDRFARTLLAREHLRFVRVEPSRKELAAWARAFDSDAHAFPEIVRGWMLSDAYAERVAHRIPQPNRLFVRSLFVDLLDRLPDEEEARRMRGALDGLSDPGPLRSILARLLLDSGTAPLPEREEIDDPSAWVASLFPRLLGRPATPDELAAFVGAFHEPDCRPSTVVYAILSHPEYHRF